MWKPDEARDRTWVLERFKRHFGELFRLSTPAVLMRIGILGLAMVDTAIVGHYATRDLAWLNLANQSVIMFALVVGIGLMSSILVFTANEFGGDNLKACGRVWRRSIPFTIWSGVIIAAATWPGELWLTMLGQSEEDARISGALIRILGLGIPGHLLFLSCTMFLEGVKRGQIGFWLMLAANIVNLVLDYGMVFGRFGFPEMGAAGSAWASTAVRWFLGAIAFAYVWWSPAIREFGVREPHGQRWRDWADQRMVGYAAAVAIAAEVVAFGGLAIFAGWLGTLPLAAQGVTWQIIGLPNMISIGIGVAASVRVGIAFARRDRFDTLLAGVSGIMLNFTVTGIFTGLIFIFVEPALGVFTDDTRIIDMLVPLTIFFTFGMVFDAAQMVVSSLLRGFKETWWPTLLQAISFMGVMLPACWLLAFPAGLGLKGLMIGTIIGCFVSWVLQLARFHWLLRPVNR